MTTIEAILLGLLQGLTEFLPVSSSAHLVAAQKALGIKSPGVLLEVSLHFGTLLAILLLMWQPAWQTFTDGFRGALLYLRGVSARQIRARAPLATTALAVAVGTVPTALAGVFFEARLASLFDSARSAGALLIVTGLLLVTSRFARTGRAARAGPLRGLLIGVAQSAALLPGISRSGATIVAGMHLGLDRRNAVRFSFLLAVPALLGATAWELRHYGEAASAFGSSTAAAGLIATGMLVSALSGAVCLAFLLRVAERGRLHWFAVYCLPAGAAMFLLGGG